MMKNSSVPLDCFKLSQAELRHRGIFWKPRDPKQSTEFTYLRFLVPYLSNYQGWAMFCDDDFLWTGDIKELIDQLDDSKAIMCVKHTVNTPCTTKLAGCVQEAYPRKNWSSMVFYNCGHPANRGVDLEMVNSQPGSFLHRFSWIKDDNLIGEFDHTWNWLVGWYEKKDMKGQVPKAIHYTEGGPYFPDWREDEAPFTDYHDEWVEYMKEYEAQLPKQRLLCPYERFSLKGNKPMAGYPNSNDMWSWETDSGVVMPIMPPENPTNDGKAAKKQKI
mmetsp:Transcript_17394/g.55871  ORF Transcript_17394/g.55871 Transcript_17394/m.55871 type:complete len:274 (-) Transcript_17394:63-884(-)